MEREPINYTPESYINKEGNTVYIGYCGNAKDKLVSCPKCEYEWATKGKLLSICCPNCNKKFPNPTLPKE